MVTEPSHQEIIEAMARAIIECPDGMPKERVPKYIWDSGIEKATAAYKAMMGIK